jgi:hypothetical protein
MRSIDDVGYAFDFDFITKKIKFRLNAFPIDFLVCIKLLFLNTL